jgi:hypothetical protein
MALDANATTRIDQLAADLRRKSAAALPKVAVHDDRPLFTQHPDGSVYDRQGNMLRGPVKR